MRSGATWTCTTLNPTGHTDGVKSQRFDVIELAKLNAQQRGPVADELARWHAWEWGHLYDPTLWNFDVAQQEFSEQISLGGGETPTTYVALDPTSQPVGSISLVTHDDLMGFEHLGPWLASLFVTPRCRGLGLGQQLIAHLLDQPPARRAGVVYLFTAGHADWYEGLGWQRHDVAVAGPDAHPVTVMRRTLPN